MCLSLRKFKEWVHTGKFVCKIQGLFKDLKDLPMVSKLQAYEKY